MLPFKLISLNQQAEWITRMSGPMAFLCPRGTEDQPWLPLISRTEEAKSTPGTPRITAVVWDPTATYTRGQVVAHPDQNGVPRYWVAAHDNQNCVPGVPVGPSPAPDLDAAEISDIGAGDGGEGAAAPAGASA